MNSNFRIRDQLLANLSPISGLDVTKQGVRRMKGPVPGVRIYWKKLGVRILQ